MVRAYLDVTNPNIVAGIGFLLGTFDGSLLAAINRAIKAADLWALIFGPTSAALTLHVSLALAGARHIFMVTFCSR